MKAYVAAFVMAALAAVILTPIVRRLAMKIGAVDLPGGRHVHKASTPRLGGIAIFFAVVAPIATLFFVESSVAKAIQESQWRVIGALVGGLGMAAMGAVDDLRGIRALYKLYAQIAAGAFAFGCGLRIDAISLPFIGPMEMGIFALPITVFWVVGVINAVNLIDGLDGLAAGIVFFAALTNFVVAYVTGSIAVGAFMASMLGALLGFLLFNFNPARIFMGDSGSYFLGFLLATSALMGTAQKASTSVALLAPVIALGVPIFDTLFAIIRRFLERRPLFSPDRGHLHHRLLDMGITHRRAVLILYGVSVLFTVAAIAVSLGRNWEVGFAIFGATVVVIGLVRFVGVLQTSHVRNRQKRQLRPQDVELLRRHVPALVESLRDATDPDLLVKRVSGLGAMAGITKVDVLETRGREETIVASWEKSDQPSQSLVSARFPLSDQRLRHIVIKYTWRSDEPTVSPQADILLQIVTDAFERAHLRTLSPAPSPERPESASFGRIPVVPDGSGE